LFLLKLRCFGSNRHSMKILEMNWSILRVLKSYRRKKRLNNLSPYFDSETGLIRVGWRIHNTSLPEETKYPVILPHQNRFIALLIQEAHEKQLHAVTNQYPHAYKTRVLDHSRKKCSEESSESVSYLLLFQDHISSTKDSTSPRGAMTPSQCWHISIDFLGPLYIKNEFQEAEKARVIQHVQYISSSHAAWPPKVFYWLWQGWCQEEARLTWFGLTILNHLKTLTMSSANTGKLSKVIFHRKGSRVVVFIGSPFALVNWRNVDNTYSSRGTNKQLPLDVLQQWHKWPAPTHTSRNYHRSTLSVGKIEVKRYGG